jgi:hypothetical protein
MLYLSGKTKRGGIKMGLNFYCGCHKCKKRVFLYRGKEAKPLHAFFLKHQRCIHSDPNNFVVMGDYEEQNWMNEYTVDELQEKIDIDISPKLKGEA